MSSQRYVIHGDGNIVSGDIRDSQIASQIGPGGAARITVGSAGGADRQLELLGSELARIRRLLEPVASADRDDALDAVAFLEADLPELAGANPVTLRRRLKGLLGALDPVVKIIGGVATLQEILRHL
jgi:hypothetical protein